MLVNLTLLAGEAASAHGEKMWDVEDLIATMARDLVPHMRREEQYLFPYIGTLEREMGPDETIVVPLFGTIEYPLQSIRHGVDEGVPQQATDHLHAVSPKGVASDRAARRWIRCSAASTRSTPMVIRQS